MSLSTMCVPIRAQAGSRRIVTRNQKDFEKSLIKVFDCDELFAYLAEEKGLTYEEMPW